MQFNDIMFTTYFKTIEGKGMDEEFMGRTDHGLMSGVTDRIGTCMVIYSILSTFYGMFEILQ